MKTGNAPKIRHIGKTVDSVIVPRECYTGIVLLRELFDWTYFDIGSVFSVTPDTIRNICKKWNRS